MSTPALDISRPESAAGVGSEMATIAETLTVRLADSTITDLPGLEQAVVDRQVINDAVKQVQAFFKPLKQMADRLHSALCDRENAIVHPLVKLDGVKRDAIRDFKAEQDRQRQARERGLFEQRRRDDEARAAEEAARLETAGDHELAAAVLAEQITAPPAVVVLPDVTKQVAGLKFRKYWRWRYLAADPTHALVPREFLVVDESKLTKYATAMQASAKVAGIEFFSEDVPVR